MLVPSFKRIGAYVFLLVFVITSPSLVVAQDERSEARLRQIEAEIRALQRQVFPEAIVGSLSRKSCLNDPSSARVKTLHLRLL